VEEVIARLEGVEQVVTVGAGGSDGAVSMLRAYVVCCRPLTPESVQHWCRTHLADHKVPRSVVVVDELPRTARGKIDHSALRRLAAAHAGD
jgi:acyl-CoA synthetase (AMP-forming)/AMP-acid ligase II